ncbi:MAG: hypothetical protein ABI810_08110 [Sphingomonas bacterium]
MTLAAIPKAWTGAALLVFLTLAAALYSAMHFAVADPQVVKTDRYSDTYPTLLVFDLQDDAHPSAAVAVNSPPQPSREEINIPLLFPSKPIDTNERGLVRLGFYDRWTMVTFSGLGRSWPQQISLAPGLVRSTDPTIVEARPEAGAFLIAQGQVRRFTYRYPAPGEIEDLSKRAGGVAMVLPSAIAVTIPATATEKSVAFGQLTIPARIDQRELVFPGAPQNASERYLKIAYEMPPSEMQTFVVEWGLKIAAALLPIALLFFVEKSKLTSPGFGHALAIGAAMAMLGLFATSIWMGVQTGNLANVMPDILLIVISAVGSVATLMLKKD